MSASVWKKVKLINKADVNRGGSPRPIEAYITENMDGINWIKIGDVEKGAKYIEKTKERIIPEGESHSRKVVKGDFLLSNSMSFGRPYILHVDGCIHDGWLAIQNYNESFNTEFLYYLLSSDDIQRQYKSLAAGSTVLNLNKDIVSDAKVTYPIDLEEQKHISDILSTCDTVIQNTQKTIEKYKAIKQGMMQDLFTRGLTKDGKLRPSYEEAPELYKPSELGMIPKDWEVDSLENISDKTKPYPIVDGPFGSNLKLEHYRTSGIPVIQSGFVTSNKFFAKEYVYVDENKFREEIRSKVEPGDIVMAKIGAACGTCALLPLDHPIGILAGNSLKISIASDCSSKFYEIILHEAYNSGRFDSIILTTAQPAVNMASLKKLQFIKPLFEEQTAIANRISSIDSTIQKEEAILAKYKNIKTGLMARLLTPPEDAQIIDETEE